ncbi:hypothetical protein SAMN02745157_3416 [Kaistia soli DSM 19436]|uniref:Lipoprotein n=1 Tax=Kaistia soli DSM 19436 TaxID=1122133 RepID=A0A1M5GIP4_9HYPH|nr:hypothetical protein [Kaistia soli]SHG03401.1 hypothetical protein SAMN02745157_3416 [Kaistia soli DSM 19436]
MHRIAAISLVAGLLAGCQTPPLYTADMSFAKATGLGYWNTGLLPVGRLYLWDTKNNRLTLIADDIPLAKRPTAEPKTELSSTNVQGIAVEGSFGSDAIKTAVTAEVGRQVAFTAKGAVREQYASIYTGLARAYSDAVAAGEDVDTHWSVTDATRPNSGLYYLIISGVVRADQTSLTQKGLKDENIANISVSVPGLGKPVALKVVNGNAVGCNGPSAACFFEATVLKPYINANRRLDFAPARDVDVKLLPGAFRGV